MCRRSTRFSLIDPVGRLFFFFLSSKMAGWLCSILHACRCICGVACDLVNLSVLMERMAQIAAAIASCPVICARPLYQAWPDGRAASLSLDASPNVSDVGRVAWGGPRGCGRPARCCGADVRGVRCWRPSPVEGRQTSPPASPPSGGGARGAKCQGEGVGNPGHHHGPAF